MSPAPAGLIRGSAVSDGSGRCFGRGDEPIGFLDPFVAGQRRQVDRDELPRPARDGRCERGRPGDVGVHARLDARSRRRAELSQDRFVSYRFVRSGRHAPG